MNIKFEGIDSWNRPVFKATESSKRFGSVIALFDYGATEDLVLSEIDERSLCYFGNSFDCEPMGSDAKDIKIIRR